MHQHRMNTMLNRRERQDCRVWKNSKWLVVAPVAMVLLSVLILSGCSSGNSGGTAVAQQIGEFSNKRIETFLIGVDSFVLKTDRAPSVEARDSATVYTMQSDGDVTFQPLGSSELRNLSLKPNDLVIERPDVGTVSVMRDQ